MSSSAQEPVLVSLLQKDAVPFETLRERYGALLELVHALLANDLVDAMSLFTVPVVLGGGKKLFDGSAPHSFQLTRSRVSPNGLIVGHYEREGEVKIGDTMLDSPSEREIARQQRLMREG